MTRSFSQAAEEKISTKLVDYGDLPPWISYLYPLVIAAVVIVFTVGGVKYFTSRHGARLTTPTGSTRIGQGVSFAPPSTTSPSAGQSKTTALPPGTTTAPSQTNAPTTQLPSATGPAEVSVPRAALKAGESHLTSSFAPLKVTVVGVTVGQHSTTSVTFDFIVKVGSGSSPVTTSITTVHGSSGWRSKAG